LEPTRTVAKKHDVIIIGGGPGGSTLGSLLAQKGYDVAIFERESFPRFHIGESLLPASMPIFKETGFYPKLNSGKYIQKFGARFVDYETDDEIYFGFEGGFNAEIPSAFEVERSQFDKDILDHAKESGVTVYQPERVKEVAFYDSHVAVQTGKGVQYQAKFVIDASGRDSVVGKATQQRVPHKDLNNVAVFSHYQGVKRNPGRNAGDIIIGLLPDRSWSWLIPFQGEKTSVGVVCSSSVFNTSTDLGAYLESRFSQSPRLTNYMKDAERTQEVTVISNYSHHCTEYAGDRWMLIGDAAAFLDPIFSSGVHVSLTSAKFASKVIDQCLKTGETIRENGLGAKYQEDLNLGIKRFHNLISLFYNTNFVGAMKKTITRPHFQAAFTSAIAGDMWNEDNIVFKMKSL
jgi:flavin-dependent dehydrogenase